MEISLPTTHRVAVIVGSLRRDSLNRKLAKALAAMAPPSLALEIVEIGGLPLYNQDDDANPPAPSAAFKEKIAAADAVLFVTPEYNRSVPGVLKNAIDIASRPYGKSAWDGKPGAVISVSPGAIGGFGEACTPRHIAWRHAHDIIDYLALNFFDATLSGDRKALRRLRPRGLASIEDLIYRNK